MNMPNTLAATIAARRMNVATPELRMAVEAQNQTDVMLAILQQLEAIAAALKQQALKR